MNWVDIIVVIIFILSFIGGAKDGAVKSFFSLVALIIAIPCAGLSYQFITSVLSFLPGTDWENFLGFFITMGIISVILHFIFFLPRKFIQVIWGSGCLFRIVGGVLNVFSAGIGMAVFVLILRAYPIITWLERVVSSSGVLTSLTEKLGFIQALLPEVFHKAAPLLMILTAIRPII